MMPPQGQSQVPIERWRLWLGRILLLPLVGMTGGLLFGLYRILVSGEVHVVSKGYRVSSSEYTFAENPVTFVVFFVLYALLAAFFIFVTVAVVRRVTRSARPG